jgi:hypothetical protein
LLATTKHKIPRVGLRAEESARFAPTARDDDGVLVNQKIVSLMVLFISIGGGRRIHPS